MEMEGRGYSDLLRNTSEEMLLKSLMENTIGISAPSMEMLGFKNISQTLRVDSEELFNSWLSNGEIPGFNLATIPHRTRQVSRRISTELAVSSSQQNGDAIQKKSDNNLSLQNLSTPDEHMSDVSQRSLRNPAEKGMEAGNLYLAKAWFHSNHSMTRSRSSELRRRYVAMQNSQTAIPGPPHYMSGRGTNQMKQALTNTSNLCDVSTNETPNQLQTFMSPSSSSTSPFNNPDANVDTVSSVVSMLKGTLERKKTGNQFDKGSLEGSSFEFYNSQQVAPSMNDDQVEANHASEPTRNFHIISSIQVQGSGNLASVDRSAELNFEGYVNPGNQIQMSTFSREPSQSESSAAAPAFSTGFEVCDGPAHSEQALCISESSRKHVGNGSSDHSSKAKELRDRIFENNLKNERKKGSLVRMGSISSGRSAEKGDPTKKRRVERSRKMAEAKERNLIPTLPSDMQSILKRCENHEKEVRSLKLNLSFMNRKDSEQTKQIEELQKQNEDLMEEKERLLEEIERIISEPGRM